MKIVDTNQGQGQDQHERTKKLRLISKLYCATCALSNIPSPKTDPDILSAYANPVGATYELHLTVSSWKTWAKWLLDHKDCGITSSFEEPTCRWMPLDGTGSEGRENEYWRVSFMFNNVEVFCIGSTSELAYSGIEL